MMEKKYGGIPGEVVPLPDQKPTSGRYSMGKEPTTIKEVSARILALERITKYLNEHPETTLEEFHDIRNRIFDEALVDVDHGVFPSTTINKARAEYHKAIRNFKDILDENVMIAYKRGKTTRAISFEFGVMEPVIKDIIESHKEDDKNEQK